MPAAGLLVLHRCLLQLQEFYSTFIRKDIGSKRALNSPFHQLQTKYKKCSECVETSRIISKGLLKPFRACSPQTATQLCIVHQIRNSCKYVVWKDRKQFCTDLRDIYAYPTREAAEQGLASFELKWTGKYKHAIQSWQTNWENLTRYFDYPLEIRKLIYTTNNIENLNRGIRKYTKTKVQFPDDTAAEKAVYLAIRNIEAKWNMPLQNWGLVLHQFLTAL